jgi:hypothetical protein
MIPSPEEQKAGSSTIIELNLMVGFTTSCKGKPPYICFNRTKSYKLTRAMGYEILAKS